MLQGGFQFGAKLERSAGFRLPLTTCDYQQHVGRFKSLLICGTARSVSDQDVDVFQVATARLVPRPTSV